VRKLTGIVAALLLTMLALAGCSSNGGSNSASGTATPASTTGSGGGDSGGASAGGTLTIAWAQWPPSEYLQTLSKDFTKETGITVKVEQIPWKDYQTKIQTGVWAGHNSAYDIIIGDSQWLGRGAVEGHYVNLDDNDWSKNNIPWDEISPSAKTFYCVYNGKTYGVPCEADAIGFAYRKDMFEDPANKTAFQAQFHHPLEPPKTWNDLRDLAEFFNHPDKKQYGVALFYGGPDTYDGITMGFMQVLWCLGGDLHDASGKVDGVINSPTSVDALKFYTGELKKYTPPGSENYYYDQCLQAFQNGQVAMAMDWYTFFPALTDKSKNALADKTGFFVSPEGPKGHFISLGGQGASISAYSNHVEDAKKFLAWFSKKETQAKWATMGGLTSNTAVLQSDAFKNATLYNPQFAESAQYLRDFYNNPKYAELLESTQKHWNAAATGNETPQQAMDAIAKEHTDILKSGGLLQ
jgi:multiple sugar transport system substrate-binding protein